MEKVFLRINLYAHNKKEFLLKRERMFNQTIEKSKPSFENESDWRAFSKDYLPIFQRINPSCYYNDIVGYAEISFHNTDIRISYFMDGDKRRKYNKNEYQPMESNKIYKKGGSQGDAFPYIKGDEKLTNTSIKKVLTEVLNKIENTCNGWNVYFDKEEYLEKINYFDFMKYISVPLADADL